MAKKLPKHLEKLINKARNGKRRIGRGPAVYATKKDAVKAYLYFLAQQGKLKSLKTKNK